MRTIVILSLATILSACGGGNTESGTGGAATFNTTVLKIVDISDPIEFTATCPHEGALGCYSGPMRTIFTFPPAIREEAARHNLTYQVMYDVVIDHEECHDRQYQEGRPFNESECYKGDPRL